MSDQTEPTYPEHEKLKAISAQSQSIGDFLMWTRATLCHTHEHTEECYDDVHRGAQCGYREGEMMPWMYNLEKVLAEFFHIDLVKLEDEKRAMLDDLRKSHK